MPTYGITPQLVADRINGFLLNDQARPTRETIEMIVEEQAARIVGYLRAKGIESPLTGNGRLVARSVLMDLCISYVERARQRGQNTLVEDAWDRGSRALDEIYDVPASMGEPLGGRVSNMAVTAPSRIETRSGYGCCGEPVSILDRMIKDGRL